MARKQPYLKFFPDDWLADERLSLCSLAAQGLWMRLLCLMHKCDRRGYLEQANGQPFTPEQTARSAGCSAEEAAHLLRELIDSGVASVSEHGAIFNRRMIREERLRTLRSEAGSKGGKSTARLLKQNLKQTGSKHSSKSAANCGSLSLSSEEEISPPDQTENIEGGVGGDLLKQNGQQNAQDAPDPFDAFWAAYPRKTARAAARKAWDRLSPSADLLGRLLAALERQKASRQWREGVIPHPATWLNGRRWEDELPFEPASPESTAERIARFRREAECREAERNGTAGRHDTPPSSGSAPSPTSG